MASARDKAARVGQVGTDFVVKTLPKEPSVGAASGDVLDGWSSVAVQKPKKRSLTISGHRTSISLEELFWDGLKAAAQQKGVSIAALVGAIDAVRGEASLSSAIRLFVYEHKEAGPAGHASASRVVKR